MGSGSALAKQPDPWLHESIPSLRTAPQGRHLDLACGAGRNSLFLGRLGLQVFGVDASPRQVAEARRNARELAVRVEFAVWEVTAAHFPPGPWSGICVFHFLDRELLALLPRHLAPGGVLVYRTHLAHTLRSTSQHPRRPQFLLRSGELLTALPGLMPLRYTEQADPYGTYAGLIARRPYSS